MFKKKESQRNIFLSLINKAVDSGKKIVLPESEDPRIIEAAEKAALLNICKVVLIGNENLLREKFSKKALKNIEIVDITNNARRREMYAKSLYELRKHKGMTEEKALEILKDPMYYATMMLHEDDADGVVAGSIYHSADVMRPALQIIKTAPNISKVSSCMIMEMPEKCECGEKNMMIFADCGVNEAPTDQDLAEIGVLSSRFANNICDMKPRVAFLSYSTKADVNVDDEQIQKIKRAYKIARRMDSMIIADGELQADAAIVPEVAKRKNAYETLEGKANVLIFPDLNSANISYKLVQRITGTKAVGPILMGLKKPINDLSRGVTSDEIVLVMAVTALQAKTSIKGE